MIPLFLFFCNWLDFVTCIPLFQSICNWLYFLKFLLHLGMRDLVALGADLLVERYHHLLLNQPDNSSSQFKKYFFLWFLQNISGYQCVLLIWNRVIFNLSLNRYFLTLRVLFLSLARNDFSRSRRWSSRRHVGWNFCIISLFENHVLQKAFERLLAFLK